MFEEEKKSIWLYPGSENLPDICWLTASQCLSFPASSPFAMLCLSKIQSGDSTGVQCWGQEEWSTPRGRPFKGTWLEGNLKTVIQSAKKLICFLLSEWQTVLNNVNNKLLCPHQKKYFCWSRFQIITATDRSEFININVSFNLAYFYCFPFSKHILCGSWLRELTLCLYFKSQCIRQLALGICVQSLWSFKFFVFQTIDSKQTTAHSDCKDKQNLSYFNSVMLCDHLEFLFVFFKVSGIYCEMGFLCISAKSNLMLKTIYLNYCFMWKKPSKIKMNEKCSLIKVGSKSWLGRKTSLKSEFTDKFAEGNT